jgi:serine/threonine-protein kinase HipA
MYDKVQEQARLAPVYDVVTTTVYMAKDSMALTLNGTTRWPDAKALQRVGETRAQSTPSRIKALFERIAEALSDTTKELRKYMTEHAEFRDVGERMLQEWEKGRDLSLRAGNPTLVAVPDLKH